MAAMEPNLTLLGGSLRVPSVQELAKKPLTYVPERYVRPDQDPPSAVSHEMASMMELPIINMQSLPVSTDSMESSPELRRLHCACEDWGFFQVMHTFTYIDIASLIRR